MSILIGFIVLCCLPLFGFDALATPLQKYYYIELRTTTFPEMQAAVKQIESQGLEVRHSFPPNKLIAIGKGNSFAGVSTISTVSRIVYGTKGRWPTALRLCRN